MNITSIINANRFEIQYNDPNVDYVSNEKAKWFFDNMTEYLDSLLGIQEEVAHRITVEVDEVLSEVVSKVKCMIWKILFSLTVTKHSAMTLFAVILRRRNLHWNL